MEERFAEIGVSVVDEHRLYHGHYALFQSGGPEQEKIVLAAPPAIVHIYQQRIVGNNRAVDSEAVDPVMR
jgi:hypothetical protein